MHSREKRRRRRHVAAFKAASVAACREPGASVAAVALERQLNANLLRRWIKEARSAPAVTKAITVTEPASAATAFVPLKIQASGESTSRSADRPIRVHIRKGRSRITIEWPASAAGACASWLRELLG